MDIKSTVEQTIKSYARKGVNGHVVFTKSDTGNEFVLVAYGQLEADSFTFTSLYAALEGETVIIYEDRNDPPLVESLMQAGIPRDKIICVYAGEEIPVGA